MTGMVFFGLLASILWVVFPRDETLHILGMLGAFYLAYWALTQLQAVQ